MTQSVTLVSAFFQFPSKHSQSQYREWIDNFMKMDFASGVIVYADEQTHQWLLETHPPKPTMQYRRREFADFVSAKWDWTADEAADHELAIGHSIPLYQVWAEKCFMIADIVRENPFQSDAFVWCDIGNFRNRDWLPRLNGFPASDAIDRRCVTFVQICPFTEEDRLAAEGPVTDRFKHRLTLSGSIFGGGADALLRYSDIYTHLLDEAGRCKVFRGMDQNMMAWIALRHPDLVHCIHPREVGYNSWFTLHWLWSNGSEVSGHHFGALRGGLGNQLFQVAALYRHQERLAKRCIRITVGFSMSVPASDQRASYQNSILSWLPRQQGPITGSQSLVEEPFNKWCGTMPDVSSNAEWISWFQHRDMVTPVPDVLARNVLKFIQERQSSVVRPSASTIVVHVRLTDYLSNSYIYKQLNIEYYRRALKHRYGFGDQTRLCGQHLCVHRTPRCYSFQTIP